MYTEEICNKQNVEIVTAAPQNKKKKKRMIRWSVKEMSGWT